MPKPIIDFDILRRVAETASAFRYRDIWVVVEYDKAGNLVIKVCDTYPEPCDECVIFPVSKVSYAPPPAVEFAFIGSGTTTVNLLEVKVPEEQMLPAGVYPADAVFWSQSAVEKFLTPYYASVYGDHAAVIVHDLLDVLKPPLAENGSEDDRAFAIAHLPASEYVTLNGAVTNLFKIRRSGNVESVGRR